MPETPTRLPRARFAALAALLAAGGPVAAQDVPLRPPVQVGACAPCHGIDGIARDVEVPHLAGQNLVYLYNQLRAFHSGARKHKEMQYMSRNLSRGEMEELARYFASLPRS